MRRKRVIAEVAGGLPTQFVTLTWRVRPDWTPDDAARAMQAAWAKYVAWHNRQHGPRALQYLAVREATKQGWPHMHIAVRARYLHPGVLSAFMKAEIDSPIVKVISLAKVRRVAAYLGKYLGKALHQFGTLKRYWRTRGYLLPEFFEDRAARRRSGEWADDPRPWQEIAFDAVLRGFKVERLAPGVFIHARAPP